MKIQFIDQLPYHIRINVSLTMILILVILVFKYAPEIIRDSGQQFVYMDSEVISIDLIEITVQEASIPAPPRPQIQVQNTQSVIIDENDLDHLFDFEESFNLISQPSRGNTTGEIVRNPQRTARVQRIVEPVSPGEPSLQNIRAEITTELTIDRSGRVIDVEVIQIRLYDRRTRTFVLTDHIDPYFIESTISAALQWYFRPALQDGTPVASISIHVFTFGSGIN